MTAAAATTPAEMRAYIVERLVGEIGEPDHVVETARALAERAVPALRDGLAECLSAPLEIAVTSVELIRFAESRPEGADLHAMTFASSPSSPDALVLLIDPEALALALCTLFGGDPDLPVAPIKRALSPTEIEVAGLVFEEVAKAVNGGGNRAFEFQMPLPMALTGAAMRKHVIRDGPAARVVYTLSSKSSSGTIALTMPQRVLLKHRSDAPSFSGGEMEAEEAWRNKFNDEVMRASIALEATMPLAKMTLGQLSRLQVGQVVDFDENSHVEARLSARDKTLFVCEFGKLGQNYTVRIRHPFDAGADLMDGLVAV